jgi:predicted secreted hydrolase
MRAVGRHVIALLYVLAVAPLEAQVVYPPVQRGTELVFPRDEGSHPDFKLEWWYVTGWLDDDANASRGPRGFQVTFFRVRTGLGEDNPSAFAPRQVLFAHAALADPAERKLRHAQRSARAAFDLAYAREGTVDVRLDDWTIRDEGGGRYRTVVRGDDFQFDLTLQATQPPMLQGERGFSRKGPDPRAASHYYSLPQLRVSGTVEVDGTSRAVTGQAWFDHEWSSDYVDERALGWDWLGINLHGLGALMAFQMRDKQGGARWASATLRTSSRAVEPSTSSRRPSSAPSGGGPAPDAVQTFEREDVTWTVLDTWRSPRTGIEYPVRWRLRVGATTYRVEPLMLDAELDSRESTGVLYWEGPVRLLDDASGRELGRGYLELTGYGGKLDL